MDLIKKFIFNEIAANRVSTKEGGELLKELNRLQSGAKVEDPQARDIAVIGIAGRIGSAEDVDQFWEMLRSGTDNIRPLPEQRMANVQEYLRVMGLEPNDVILREGAYLDAIDGFDPDFFKISQGEANLMDPNQRLFLETAWQAIEDAGYGGERMKGTETGVFLGYAHDFGDTYKRLIKDYAPEMLPMATLGNINAVITGRLSYLLDLKGMSILVDTACSSALVAVHLACQSLRNGDCKMAIAGGVKSWLIPAEPREAGEFGGDGGPGIGIEAKDGRCHTFDDNSSGAGFGEGVAAVLLKPLKQALADGDAIYAVIKGTASNQDGQSIGMSAPNVQAQEAVITKAWKDANINPESISYIEAHGTGTRLGDPIEIYAMQNAFAKVTKKKHFCSVGSVKTNVGHLDNAAGIAGLLKVVLALKHRELPPSLHFNVPNREINFIDSPVFVQDRLTPWQVEGAPLRAGISSFGLSGTNCHIVVEEAPEQSANSSESEGSVLYLLPISAKSEFSLRQLIEKYSTYVEKNPATNLASLCYTASTGRAHHQYRIAIIAESLNDLVTRLGRLNHTEISDWQNGSGIYIGSFSQKKGTPPRVELTPLNLAKDADELARLYVNGADIDWGHVYKGRKIAKVHLPTYPFQHKTCWVKPTRQVERVAEGSQKRHFYQRNWQPEDISTELVGVQGLHSLIFLDEHGLGLGIAELLKAQGQRVTLVHLGNTYICHHADEYTISGMEADYRQLLANLQTTELSQVFHLFTHRRTKQITSLTELAETEEVGIYSVLYLLKALKAKSLTGINLVLITDYAHQVNGMEEVIKPENAALLALGKVIAEEHPELEVYLHDVDWQVKPQSILSSRVSGLMAHRLGCQYREIFTYANKLKAQSERFNLGDTLDLIAATRSEIFEEEGSPLQVTLSADKVYLITGGTGGIGLELAKELAARGAKKLALFSRKPLPSRERWAEEITHSADSKLVHMLKSIRDLEMAGVQILHYQVDLANEEALRAVLADLRERHGSIRGVLHTAGVPGSGILLQRDRMLTQEVLAPKVAGTWLLDDLLKDEPLDFFILFSSISSIFGGPGQGDYSAANAYLDSFADYRRKAGRSAQVIQWTAWKETGMAKEHKVDFDQLLFAPLTNREGVQYFQQILETGATNVLVGELNHRRFAEVQQMLPIQISPELMQELEQFNEHKAVKVVKRPTVQLNEADAKPIEQQVAAIWAQILGLNTVSLDDNFYDLGGDSIIALTLINELKKEFPNTIDVADLFSRPTIRGVAELIRSKQSGPAVEESHPKAKGESDEELLNILAQLEQGDLSFEQGLELIKNMEEEK